ncbi:MAG: glycosyltransferase, partial [Pseudomonadota bacterium]
VWNPETDPHLAATYSAVQPDAKATNRAALADRFGLVPQADAPLCVVISRMSWQKGLDLLLDALPALLERGGCLAVLGTGDAQIEAGFAAAAEAHPRQVSFIRDYDEPLSHLMQGGGDAILIPSRFEPCGLTQLYGLRYGTLPVAALTGGLADTVIDANDAALAMGVATGFLHQPGSVADLEAALTRLCDTYQSPELWATLRANAMVQPVGWARSAAAYKALYAGMGGAT